MKNIFFCILISFSTIIAFAKPANSEYTIETDDMKVHFGGAEDGYSCVGIENTVAGGVDFVSYRKEAPGLWRLEFQTPPKDGKAVEKVVFSNQTECKKTVEKLSNGLRFKWIGLDLPDEKAAVDVVCDITTANDKSTEWRIKVENRSRRFGLWETYYPYLQQMSAPGKGDVLYPKGNFGGRVYRNNDKAFSESYPGWYCTVQMMAFMRDGGGIYVSPQDGEAWVRQLVITKEQDCIIQTPAKDMGQAGGAGTPPAPVVVRAFKGNWWQAARYYREWALKQYWAAKGPIVQRKDFSPLLRCPGYWITCVGDAKPVNDTIKGLQRRLDNEMPVYLHWYSWHKTRFDTHYPELRPKDGVAEAVAEMLANGHTVMPYINGRLYDQQNESWATTGREICTMEYDGTYAHEDCPQAGSVNGVICPAYTPTHDVYYKGIRELKEQLGINGIYIDQIGAATPRLCFNPKHGHPIGNGAHLVEGYNKMLAKIRELGLMMTTESNAETFIGELDGMLCWIGRQQQDIPLLPAIYSGYTVFWSSAGSYSDTSYSFRVQQARDLMWGCQLGWYDPRIFHLNQYSDRFAYLVKMIKLYRSACEFLVDGTLIDDFKVTDDTDTVDVFWYHWNSLDNRLPAVETALWRNADNSQLLLILANHSTDARRADLSSFDANSYINNKSHRWTAFRRTENGTVPFLELKDGKFPSTLQLSPEETALIVVIPSELATALPATTSDGALDNAVAHHAFQKANKTIFDLEHYAFGLDGDMPLMEFRLSGGPSSVKITWPDGVEMNYDVPRKTTAMKYRMANAGKGAQTSVKVTDTATGAAYTVPVTLRSLPTIVIDMDFKANVSPLDRLALPLFIRNNSKKPWTGTVTASVPDGWPVEMQKQAITVPSMSRVSFGNAVLSIPAEVKGDKLHITFRAGKCSSMVECNVRQPRKEMLSVKMTPTLDAMLSEWKDAQPQVLGDKLPGNKITSDYKGDADCHAAVFSAYDDNNLYIAAEITDDEHFQHNNDKNIWNGDCIQLCIRENDAINGKDAYDGRELSLALGMNSKSGECTVFKWIDSGHGGAPLTGAILKARRDETAKKTFYEAAIPWNSLGISIDSAKRHGLIFSFTVNEMDNSRFKGWLEWTGGICGGSSNIYFGRMKLEE